METERLQVLLTELRQVHLDHYSRPGDYEEIPFDEMVAKFAADDFYKLHKEAIEYLSLKLVVENVNQ